MIAEFDVGTFVVALSGLVAAIAAGAVAIIKAWKGEAEHQANSARLDAHEEKINEIAPKVGESPVTPPDAGK